MRRHLTQLNLVDAGLFPVDTAEPTHGAELAVAELDARVADHAGVEAQHLADLLLRGHAGVEAHGEVVAGGVAHLVRAYGFREGELAPVLEAADDAFLLEDELAGCEDYLPHLGEAARPDLEQSKDIESADVSRSVVLHFITRSMRNNKISHLRRGKDARGTREKREKDETNLTIPINSYNIVNAAVYRGLIP